MNNKTIELLIKKLKSISKNQKFIIQGSFALYLQKIITRSPNDLDILFFNDYNDDIKKVNEEWDKFISNFEILEKIVDNCALKKYTVIFNGEKINLECILSKNLDAEFVNNINDLYLVSPEYGYSAKICQLIYILSDKYINSPYFSIQKLNITINDIEEIRKSKNTNINIDLRKIINKILIYEYRFIFYSSDSNYWNILKSKK
ncbi:hypothetical protein PR250_03570, partial [Metamycoplasma hyosynoviae]